MRRPGRALLAAALALPAIAPLAAETPLAVHIHGDKAMFQVLISPGRPGHDSFVLQLMNGDGTLLPAKAATLILSKPEGSAPPVERKASLSSDGYWRVEDVAMPSAGRWHMRIEAETAFRKVTLEEDFDMPNQ